LHNPTIIQSLKAGKACPLSSCPTTSPLTAHTYYPHSHTISVSLLITCRWNWPKNETLAITHSLQLVCSR